MLDNWLRLKLTIMKLVLLRIVLTPKAGECLLLYVFNGL